MTEAHLSTANGRGRPLVAAFCSVPLMGEAISGALDFADVRSFSGGRDTAGLIEWLQPDAVVVDNDEDAVAASGYASATGKALLQLGARRNTLTLFRAGAWESVETDGGLSPESVRNVVAGALFARRA